ncbi:hypothetical protein [Yoonia sp.]|nr:hypothetical protein [Yoonia sp.]
MNKTSRPSLLAKDTDRDAFQPVKTDLVDRLSQEAVSLSTNRLSPRRA